MSEAIAAFLDACRYEVDWLHLPGVGWLTVRSLGAYRFSSPGLVEEQVVEAKRVPWFSAEATSALDGEASDVQVFRPVEVLPLAATIREALLGTGRCEIPGLGTFEIRVRRQFGSHEGQLRFSTDRSVRLHFASELVERVGRRGP